MICFFLSWCVFCLFCYFALFFSFCFFCIAFFAGLISVHCSFFSMFVFFCRLLRPTRSHLLSLPALFLSWPSHILLASLVSYVMFDVVNVVFRSYLMCFVVVWYGFFLVLLCDVCSVLLLLFRDTSSSLILTYSPNDFFPIVSRFFQLPGLCLLLLMIGFLRYP